jgi:hypothetical protein
MEVLTQSRLTRNAYRILGLSADASQEAIDQAARRMRLWANAKKIPDTSWDLPWLGALNRSKSDIEQAVARLADPASRLRERLMWFCGSPELFAVADVQAVRESLEQTEAKDIAVRQHNAAVAELATAILGPGATNARSWETVLNRFQTISHSADQLRWQLELENQGGFEKLASEEEILASHRAMPLEIAGSLARNIEAALEDDNVEGASAILAMLRAIGGKTDQRILDRLEGVFERRCRNIADDLRAGVRGNHEPWHNLKAAEAARTSFEETIVPLRRDLEKLTMDQPERIKRIRWHCARILSMIATAWMFSHEFVKAQEVLQEALGLAQGAVQEEEIRGQMVENEPRAQEERHRAAMVANAASGYSMSASNAGAVGPAGAGMIEYNRNGPGSKHPASPARPPLYTPRPFVPQQSKSKGGAWAAIVVGIAIIRLISLLVGSGSSSSSSRPPSYDFSIPNYRSGQQPSLFPAQPSNSSSADDILEQIRRNRTLNNLPPPTDQERALAPRGPMQYSAPKPVAPRHYLDWSPLVPAANQKSEQSAAPAKSLPAPPVRPPAQSFSADNAGLSIDPPTRSGPNPLEK